MYNIVILAAGKGVRMKSGLPKAVQPLKGKPIIEYLIESVIQSGADTKPFVVVSPDNQDMIAAALTRYPCQYVIQKKQLGTGHALNCALPHIPSSAKHVVCLYGDQPFITAQTIQALMNVADSAVTLMTTEVEYYNGWRQGMRHWGRIIRDGNRIKEIIEYKDAAEDVRQITKVNPSLFRFQVDWLKANITRLSPDNIQQEYYLTDLVKIAFDQGLPINSLKIPAREAIGINSQKELALAEEMLSSVL